MAKKKGGGPTKRFFHWTFISRHSIGEVRIMASEFGFKSKRVINLLKLMDMYGPRCVNCGIEGTHFEKCMELSGAVHLDLYSEDGSLMTIDHIKPRAKGGSKSSLDNMQIMCKLCNEIKGDDYPE